MRPTAPLIMLAIQVGFAFPLSARGEMLEAPDTGEIDEFPMAEICLLPDGMEGNTCAAFFLDEDGYEICLRDEMNGEMRCSSSYGTKADPPDMPSASRFGRFGI